MVVDHSLFAYYTNLHNPPVRRKLYTSSYSPPKSVAFIALRSDNGSPFYSLPMFNLLLFVLFCFSLPLCGTHRKTQIIVSVTLNPTAHSPFFGGQTRYPKLPANNGHHLCQQPAKTSTIQTRRKCE